MTTRRTERERLEALLARSESYVRKSVNLFLREVRSDRTLRIVRELLERNAIDAALRIVDQHVVGLASFIPHVFTNVGRAEVDTVAATLRNSRVAIAFDPSNERAASIMRASKLQFIREFTTKQRAAVRSALATAFAEGKGTAAAARAFRDSIGLTTGQLSAIGKYRSLLEVGSSEALNRLLRDRRYDRTVASSIENDDPLSSSQIDRMVGRYTDRMLAMRADNIARTESLKVMNSSRHESLAQISQQIGIDGSMIERTWRTTIDGRERDTHHAMNGQTVIGLDTPFESPSGATLVYPGDESAPAEEIINCLLPGSKINAPDLLATARGYFDGQAITIETASGINLSVTSNHPVLTDTGWKPACLIDEGDNLIRYRGGDWLTSNTDIDAYEVPALIEDVHESGTFSPDSEVVGRMNFHGDIVNREIEVRLQTRSLLLHMHSTSRHHAHKMHFGFPDMRFVDLSVYGASVFDGRCIVLAAPSDVGRGDLTLSLFLSHLRVFDEFCFASRAWPHTKFYQNTFDSTARCAVKLREFVDRVASLVTFDQAMRVTRYPFSGHVYSPQTMSGVYTSNGGIVNHNCRCTVTTRILRADEVARAA